MTPRRPRRGARPPGRAGDDPGPAPIVPIAPEDFPSPAEYLAAWKAQLAHEQDVLVDLALGIFPAELAEGPGPAPHTMSPNEMDAPNDAGDARDQLEPRRRERFRAELRARALARRYGIVSPAEWPEQAPLPPGLPPATARDQRDEDAHWAPLYDQTTVAAGPGREGWDAPADRRLRLPPGLPNGRHVALTVRGASMAPLLLEGDVVLVRLGGRALRGRVVVARHGAPGYAAGHVVKLVERVGGGSVALASIAPGHPGFEVPDDGGHVVGTVVARWGRGGRGGPAR